MPHIQKSEVIKARHKMPSAGSVEEGLPILSGVRYVGGTEQIKYPVFYPLIILNLPFDFDPFTQKSHFAFTFCRALFLTLHFYY